MMQFATNSLLNVLFLLNKALCLKYPDITYHDRLKDIYIKLML